MGLFDGDPNDIMSMITGGGGGLGGPMPDFSTPPPPALPPLVQLRNKILGEPSLPTGPMPPAQGFDNSTALPAPPPGMPPAQGLDLAPDAIAKNMAARGVPPPPVDITPGTVGAALTGQTVPVPRERPPVMAQGGEAPGAPMDIRSEAQKAGEAAGGKQEPGIGDRLQNALKGVKMPANPELQRISSPSIPRPITALKSGNILSFLQQLQAARPGGGLELPGTLGAALRR